MIGNQARALAAIIKDEDIQKYAGDSFWNLVQAVVAKDIFSGLEAAKNIKELIFHTPTVLFWDKTERFLFGTFRSYEDQVKMAQKFSEDNEAYVAFVKRQIHLIDALDDDMKVDYFAALTRCFLLTDLDSGLYFKLCKFLFICTPEELVFIEKCPYDFKGSNTAIISALFQYGLFTQDEGSEAEETYYILSDFARALKQNCLNYDDGLQGSRRLVAYEQLTPLNLAENSLLSNFSLTPIEGDSEKS